MPQKNRVLEIESKVDVIVDINQSKVNTIKQVQSNAGSVAPTILTIELNVQLPVRLALSVANKATLLLSVRKRIGFQVDQPTRYITQVQHQDMQKVASQHVNQYLTLMSLSLSLNVLGLSVATWPNPFLWYPSHFTPSTALSSQLNSTRGQYVVLCHIPIS